MKTLELLAVLELAEAQQKRILELEALIQKSNLEEVPSSTSETDSCGAPVLRSSGVILRHKGYMAEVEEKTKLLKDLASKARRIAELEQIVLEYQEGISKIP